MAAMTELADRLEAAAVAIVDLSPAITHRFPLSRFEEALDTAVAASTRADDEAPRTPLHQRLSVRRAALVAAGIVGTRPADAPR